MAWASAGASNLPRASIAAVIWWAKETSSSFRAQSLPSWALAQLIGSPVRRTSTSSRQPGRSRREPK